MHLALLDAEVEAVEGPDAAEVLDQSLDLDRVRSPLTVRHRTAARPQAFVTSTADRLRVQDRLVQDRSARVGHRQPRPHDRQRRQPRVGQHRRRPPRGRRRSPRCGRRRGCGPRGRRRPRRPAAPGCRGAGRTAAGSGRRPSCAPARGAVRSCARPSRRRPSARRRSRPCGPAARPTPPAPRRPRRRQPPPAGPSYAASKGSRAVKWEPSSAAPRSAPSATDELGAAVAGREVVHPARPARWRGRGRRARRDATARQARRPAWSLTRGNGVSEKTASTGHVEERSDAQGEVQAGAVLAALEVADGLVVHPQGGRQVATGDALLGTEQGDPVVHGLAHLTHWVAASVAAATCEPDWRRAIRRSSAGATRAPTTAQAPEHGHGLQRAPGAADLGGDVAVGQEGRAHAEARASTSGTPGPPPAPSPTAPARGRRCRRCRPAP